jgi:hypothetical protein
MAIGNMMNYLMNSPSSFAIRSMQLCLVQVQDCILYQVRQELQVGKPFNLALNGKWLLFILPDRVLGVNCYQ